MKRFSKGVLLVSLALVLLLGATTFARDAAAKTNIPLVTYFARVQDNPTYQMINLASVWFGKENLKGTEYEDLPLISRQSTTYAGFRGADDFLNVPAGELSTEDIEKIYRYSNTVQALKLNGKQVIEWLEASAGNFNQIDPEKTEDQFLINYGFDSHLLDHFWGITYMFDVTKPVGSRVVDAKYQGTPITEDMDFIVMTDNYRAGGGGGLPNAVPENIVMMWDVNFRTVIADYLNAIDSMIPKLVINWSIKPVETKGKVILKTGPEWGTPVIEYLDVAAEMNLEQVDQFAYEGTEDVWGLFTIDLSMMKTPY